MSAVLWRSLPCRRTARRTLMRLALLFTATLPAALSAAERAPLRRAIVPVDRAAARPVGDWQQVPAPELLQFEQDYRNGAIVDVAPPLIDRLVFRGSLTDGAGLAGRFEAEVRRFDPNAAFLGLGPVTPAITAIEWTDRPAIWGSAPDGTVLLYVDRETDAFTGQWSQQGDVVLGGAEFDVRVFPAASIRFELTLPAEYELHASRGVVLPPADDGAPVRLWAIELGQQTACLITVLPTSDRPPVVSMSVERSAAWSIRPDGCRLQADYNISIPASAPATLEFEIPDELQNPEVTTTSNLSLPSEVDRRLTPPRLIVPLPRLSSGRLGIIRVSGDLALRTGDDWTLPDIRLENSTVLNSIRRMHIDRPLKLLSLDLEGVRQTDISIEDSGGDWTFEDTSSEARVAVRIGRPPALLTLGAVTLIEPGQGEFRFRTAAELISRSGGDYRADLWLPAGWNVIEVGSVSGDRGPVTSWRTTDTDAGVRLEIDFRQSLSSQSPRRVLISGRRIGALDATDEIQLFPTLDRQGPARVWLGIRRDGLPTGSPALRGGARAFDTAGASADWSRLSAALGVADGGQQWSWFTLPEGQSSGTIAWDAATTGESTSPAPTDVATPGVTDLPDPGRFAMDLLLETETGGPETAWVRHRAQFLLSGRRPDHPPKIRMPPEAQIDGLAIDGQPQNVIASGETLELLEWPASPRAVEIRYRTPAAGDSHWLSRRLDVPLPIWDVAPQSLEWRLAMPRTERLADVHVPCSAVLPRPESGWTSRLFGPLGRDHWQQTANPLSLESWRRRLWPTEQAAISSSGAVTIRTPTPGAVLSIELANQRNVERAGWLLILGAVLIAALLRRLTRGGSVVLWIAACLLLIGISALPYVAATLCGGALTGVLIGTLLPRPWIARSLPVTTLPLRPSSLTRAEAVAGAVLLMLNVCSSQLRAQPMPANSDRSSTATVDSAPDDFDLLIPGTAGTDEDSAWIQRRLLPLFERWMRTRHRNPKYLIQSADYALEPADTPQVQARYTVAVFDRRPVVQLRLPFGRLLVPDPDACRVDGQPSQIRPSASSSALLVELPGRNPDASSPVRIVEVELTLQLSAAARTGTGWEFDVPPVLDSEVSLPAAEDVGQDLTVASEVERADADGRRLFGIGGRSTVVLRTASPAASPYVEALAADAVSLIEVYPLRLRVRTQLVLASAPQSGQPSGPQRLRLVLPEQADVREVAVGGLRSFSVRHPQRDSTLVELELDRWPAPNTGIHLDFTLPVRRTPEGIVVPPLPLLRDNRVQNHHIGLRAGPGMRLEPLPASRLPAAMHEMPAELFSSGLTTDNAWPIPSLVYVATAPAPLTVTAEPLQHAMSVAFEQSIVVGDDALHWQGTADLEIAVIPAFHYEFVLSAAVDLTAVTLLDGEVERSPEWSHIGDRLLLFLPGDRIGKQQVRLTGTMRFDPHVSASLPVFTMRDVQIMSSELLIQSGPSRRLELFTANGDPLPPVAGRATGGAMQFTLQDTELPSAFRALPAPDALSISVVTTFDRTATGWNLVTRITPAHVLADGESIQVSLPPELAGQVTASGSTAIDRIEGGTIVLSAQQFGDEHSARVPLVFRFPVHVPDHGEWNAPRAKFLNATVTGEFTVLPIDFPLSPAPGAATSVASQAWSRVLPDRPTLPDDPTTAAVYRWTGDELIFQDRNPSSTAPDLRLVETTLWRDGNYASGGEATFWLIANQSRCDVEFDWPATVELRSAKWDWRHLEPVPRTDTKLAFRIDGASPGSLHRLTLNWSRSGGESGAKGEFWRPEWSRETTATEFATILHRPAYVLLPTFGQPARSAVLKDRAESILNLVASLGPASSAAVAASLTGEFQTAVDELELLSPSEAQALRARRAALPARSAAAVLPEATQSNEPPAPSLSAVAWRDPGALTLQLSGKDGEIQFWELHTGLTAAAACLAGLIVPTLCLRFRTGIAHVLSRLPIDPVVLQVLTLGLLWWIWLKFGGVAVVLVLSAIVIQRRARNEAAAPAGAPAG